MKRFAFCLLLLMSCNAIAMQKNSPQTPYSQLSSVVKRAAPYLAYTVGLVAIAGSSVYAGYKLAELYREYTDDFQPEQINFHCDYVMITESLNITHDVRKLILNCAWRAEN